MVVEAIRDKSFILTYSVLQALKTLSALPESALRDLALHVQYRNYQGGDVLQKEDEPVALVYVNKMGLRK